MKDDRQVTTFSRHILRPCPKPAEVTGLLRGSSVIRLIKFQNETDSGFAEPVGLSGLLF